jgi:uncharacterized Zn finger protein
MKLTQQQIKAFIDDRYIERGKAYLAQGMVQLLDNSSHHVSASCAGTRLYRVELAMAGSRLSGTCNCPAFSDFGPCKHMAATALACIDGGGKAPSPSPTYLAQKKAADDLEKRLKRKTKAELIDIILTVIDNDPEFLAMIFDDDQDDEWA